MPRKQRRRPIATYPPSACLYLPSFPSLPHAEDPQVCTAILRPRGNHQVPLLRPTLEITTCAIATLLVGPGMGLRRKDPRRSMRSVSQIGMGSALVECTAEKLP
jgi:hypothetical protein